MEQIKATFCCTLLSSGMGPICPCQALCTQIIALVYYSSAMDGQKGLYPVSMAWVNTTGVGYGRGSGNISSFDIHLMFGVMNVYDQKAYLYAFQCVNLVNLVVQISQLMSILILITTHCCTAEYPNVIYWMIMGLIPGTKIPLIYNG